MSSDRSLRLLAGIARARMLPPGWALQSGHGFLPQDGSELDISIWRPCPRVAEHARRSLGAANAGAQTKTILKCRNGAFSVEWRSRSGADLAPCAV